MAEPTKLTQAQALFAVLAGAAQSRRERVYYRDWVLRTTLYNPINIFDDTAVMYHVAYVETITGKVFDLSDVAAMSYRMEIDVSYPLDPKDSDTASMTYSTQVITTGAIKFILSDTASVSHDLAVISYMAVSFALSDTASCSHSIQVITL
ncbi:hypothetical protein L5M28_07490 [Shewanella sp. SW32]|uniref:hypothetical protein n=1 Tax=unclassified Shewanella TaxID=196818 RepID=UPI0021DAF192|nr:MULTISPECIES: hypothetical protein [unclassified Shewanella]MCU7962421.1 hypothetical protein [Shewanella sp. SW32]MCU7969237.1 hypothetical protein [Shewanella sp. SW29]